MHRNCFAPSLEISILWSKVTKGVEILDDPEQPFNFKIQSDKNEIKKEAKFHFIFKIIQMNGSYNLVCISRDCHFSVT